MFSSLKKTLLEELYGTTKYTNLATRFVENKFLLHRFRVFGILNYSMELNLVEPSSSKEAE